MSETDTPTNEPIAVARALLLDDLGEDEMLRLETVGVQPLRGRVYYEIFDPDGPDGPESIDILNIRAWRCSVSLAAYLATLDSRTAEFKKLDPREIVGPDARPSTPDIGSQSGGANKN